MGPPVGFAPTWAALQERCLSGSATEADKWCAMPVLPWRRVVGSHACFCYTNSAMKWPLDLDLHQDLLLFRETRRLTTPSSDEK